MPVFGSQMHPCCSLVYHFIWTDHGRCMRWTILTYLSPVRGSIEVIRWSLMPYGNSDSLHKANFSFMALLTLASTLGESTAGVTVYLAPLDSLPPGGQNFTGNLTPHPDYLHPRGVSCPGRFILPPTHSERKCF